MLRNWTFCFVVGMLFVGCDAVNTIRNQNEPTSQTISQDETNLPKEIFLLIGRGSCCNGHMVTVTKEGDIKYFVGSYRIPNDSSEMPETYDSQLVKQDPKYEPKYQKISQEKIKLLRQLIDDEQELRFNDKVEVDDDFVYTFFLDNKKIAFGYESRKTEFPKNLAEVLALILAEVELYKLPGMA